MSAAEAARGVASDGWRTLRGDVLAGLTVALVGLPQCLAYALMSGLGPAYGLATAAVPGLLAALAGKSAHVVTGPTNTTGLLILAALGPWLGDNGLLRPDGLGVLAALTLLAGAVRIVAALAGGAQLLRFLPESVLVGFTAGAGILIATMQLDEAVGVGGVRADNLLGELSSLASAVSDGRPLQWRAIFVTALTAASIGFVPRRMKRFPMALLAVVVAMTLCYGLGMDASAGLPIVRDRAQVPSGWPAFASPDLSASTLSELLLPALAITVLGTLELTVVAHGGGARPDMKRELLAQGIANLGGAFAGAFPASASLTRSALLRLGAARTRAAAAVAALAVVPVLFFGAQAVGYIPQASLAGVLFVTAFGMIDRVRMLRMWRANRVTRSLLLLTLVATLTLPLEWAILVGAGGGLLLHLAQTSTPRIRWLVSEGARLRGMTELDKPELVVVEVSGNLHYAAVPAFFAALRRGLPSCVKVVIVDLSHAHDLRFAALTSFEELAAELAACGTRLRLAGVSEAFGVMLQRAGSQLQVTPEAIEPGRSVRSAIAKELGEAPSTRASNPVELRPLEDEARRRSHR